MRVGILQPGYLPWLGFFEQVYRSDLFVLLDDVQYTKNDWRNRNRVRGPNGIVWLTVPVRVQGRHMQLINEATIDNRGPWSRKHRGTLDSCYSRAPHYPEYAEGLRALLERPWDRLVDLDVALIGWVCEKLGVTTSIILSSELPIHATEPNMRLVQICEQLGADRFYEGSSGRSYIDVGLFESRGVSLEWQSYEHPSYRQQWADGTFVSHLSVVDLLFNHGPDSLGILAGDIQVPTARDLVLVSADELARGRGA